MTVTAQTYGLAVGRSEFSPRRSVVTVDRSAAGNTILRVGREVSEDVPGQWQQTEHVVLTPDETRALVEELTA